MNVKEILKAGKRFAVKNAPTIGVGLGIGGMVGTIVLAFNEAPKLKKALDEKPEAKFLEKVKIAAPIIWPVIVTGTLSAGCIILSNSENLKRNAAALAMYKASETSYKELKDAATRVVGEKKTEEILDEKAKDKVRKNPPTEQNIYITGSGDQLCYDAWSGRYFRSTIEKIRRAQNDVNTQIINENTVSLNEFYDFLPLSHISGGDREGFDQYSPGGVSRLDIRFTSMLTPSGLIGIEEGVPVLVMEYDVAPLPMYD